MIRRPEVWFGLSALAFAAGIAYWPPNGVAQLLAFVLAGCALRFLTLPSEAAQPNRRTGALLAVPFVVGVLFLFIEEGTRGKTCDGNVMQVSGWLLLSAWLVLMSFENWWWQRSQRRRARAILE